MSGLESKYYFTVRAEDHKEKNCCFTKKQSEAAEDSQQLSAPCDTASDQYTTSAFYKWQNRYFFKFCYPNVFYCTELRAERAGICRWRLHPGYNTFTYLKNISFKFQEWDDSSSDFGQKSMREMQQEIKQRTHFIQTQFKVVSYPKETLNNCDFISLCCVWPLLSRKERGRFLQTQTFWDASD